MAKPSQDYNEGLLAGLNSTTDFAKADLFREVGPKESDQPHIRHYWTGAYRGHHLRDIEAEYLEQARLLGMSSEREANHLGQIERLERELARVTSQRDTLEQACRTVAEQLDDHPACMDASSTQEDIDAEGGDAAFLTWNLQTLLDALHAS
jgi:septal ring factor EnvC (AmiA/AmiB activator)